MSQTSLGKLFDSGANKIEAIIDTIEDLGKPVSAGALPLAPLKVDLPDPKLSLFDTPLKISGNLQAQVEICASNATFTPFDETETVTAPAGTSFAHLGLSGELDASATPSGNAGSFQISAEASAKTSFSYLHLLPAPAATTRLDALVQLAKRTQLPQAVLQSGDMVDGQVVSFDGIFNIDLGVKAKFGKGIDLSAIIHLVDDFDLPVKAHVDFSIDAALGFSFYEELKITVARNGLRNPGWVRARLDRKEKTSITFGAAFALAVQYDAASGAHLLLDRIFAMLPMPKINDALAEVAKLAGPAAQGDWQAVTSQISGAAASLVARLVDDTGWKNWLADSPEAKRLIAASSWIVKTYDQIEPKVKSIWEKLLLQLNQAGFDKVMAAIRRVAAIDVSTIKVEDLIGPQFNDLIDLIETLSGHDIEELLITGDVKDALGKAVSAAKKIVDTVDNAPDKLIAQIRAFADKSGITSVVTWLRNNATSVAALQNAGDEAVKSVVEKLVGKALSQINASDLAKIQRFANKVLSVVSAAQNLPATIGKAVDKLKGQAGVTLSLEFSRTSEFSAVVDLEFDPSSSAAATPIKRFLPAGDFQSLLRGLDAIKPAQGSPLPYAIREMILTSRKVRTSTTSLMISFLGVQQFAESRIEEITTTFTTAADGSKQRKGQYSGGATTRSVRKSTTAESGAWVNFEGISAADLGPFDAPVGTTLRLTYVREDPKTTDDELQSMASIVSQLGFLNFGASLAQPPAGNGTRFSVEIILPAEAVRALVSDTNSAAWDLDARNAADRWFNDRAANNDVSNDLKRGQQMAQVVRSSAFAQTWNDLIGKFHDAAVAGEFPVGIIDFTGGGNYFAAFNPLINFVAARGDLYGGYRDFQAPLANTAAPAPDALKAATDAAVTMFNGGGIDWVVPLLNFWLVLARVTRTAPDTLKKALGLMTLASRSDDQSDWSTPQRLRLVNGITPPPRFVVQ